MRTRGGGPWNLKLGIMVPPSNTDNGNRKGYQIEKVNSEVC